MSESIKQIIADFLQQDHTQISDSTAIDRSALGSSVVVHRLYARLAEGGFAVNDYHDISTYGDLLGRLNGDSSSKSTFVIDSKFAQIPIGAQVGIDIELVSTMPLTNDFREHEFCIGNFSQAEISHCILQSDPYASFAGLFAAKEALYKAGAFQSSVPFSQVEIRHDQNGRPFFGGYAISISHAGGSAVAVAVSEHQLLETPFTSTTMDSKQSGVSSLFSIIALIISLATLLVVILWK